MQPIGLSSYPATYAVETRSAESQYTPSSYSEEYSLSKYFPKGSVYFYAFPAGEESGFFNNIAPWIEELVAARPLLCAGPDIKVLTFAPSAESLVWQLMDELGTEMISPSRIMLLPRSITSDVEGAARNQAIKGEIAQIASKGEIIMAQPYTDKSLRNAFQIAPEITVFLNDKKNMNSYIHEKYLPKEYGRYENGKIFADSQDTLPIPCVIKISSSSAGDGVRICRTAEDLEMAKKDFSPRSGLVIAYEFIKSVKNYCIQFGIPFDTQKEIEIIGFNEQVIGKCGEFLGGMVPAIQHKKELEPVYEALLHEILPKVRAMGWYGVGGLDVLLTEQGDFYCIDPNFRMTATFAFVTQVRNKKIKKSLLGFTGTFNGPEAAFRDKILPIARFGTDAQLLNIVSLTHKDEAYRFNGAIVFGENETPEYIAKKLLDRGIESLALSCLAS